MTRRILWVDDEPNVLVSARRLYRNRYQIDVATDGEQALAKLRANGPYAVVVSDLRMPRMDGIELLSRCRETSPDTVRIMLTGAADLKVAVEAVNRGEIFRFLEKPVDEGPLTEALDAALRQYELAVAERELLEETLTGAVRLLLDMLSLSHPTAFARAARIRGLVHRICEVLAVPDAWQVEVAAMLSQIGCVAIPEPVLARILDRRQVSEADQRAYETHPQLGAELIRRIPRLEPVAAIVAAQNQLYEDVPRPPLGARVVKAALDYDQLLSAGLTEEAALVRLRARPGWYDPAVLDALERIVRTTPTPKVRRIPVVDLEPGMVLAEDVRLPGGALVVCRGQEVTPLLCERLRNFVPFVHEVAIVERAPAAERRA